MSSVLWKMKTKIIHLHNIRWWNAVSHYAWDLMRALDSLGFDQRVITGKNNPINDRLSASGFQFHPILPDKDIQYFPLFLKKLPLSDAQIIITYWGRDQELALRKKSKKQKLIRIRMDARRQNTNFAAKKLFAGTDMIVFPSELEKDRFEKSTGSYPGMKILPGSVSACYSKGSSAGSEGLKILHVARTSPVKGHKDLLNALSVIKKQDLAFTARFIGNETEISLRQLRAFCTSLGISEECEFFGFVQDTSEFYKWADIGIIASRASEVYSRALLECISYGVPVAATAVGIIPEIGSQVDFGDIIEPQDSAALAHAILNTHSRRAEILPGISEYCRQNLSFESFTSRVGDLFSDPLLINQNTK